MEKVILWAMNTLIRFAVTEAYVSLETKKSSLGKIVFDKKTLLLIMNRQLCVDMPAVEAYINTQRAS